MGIGTGNKFRRTFLAIAVAVVSVAALALPAFPGDYPRRVAVAPFVSLASEDISRTVSVLPRLISSRLMALTGAEVLLLPAGEKPAAEQAKGAGMPLLLQGTVAKLGKGYSIDVTVSEAESGKSAGAFFAAAATEDEIIPQLGFLAGEIAEKVFGVKAAPRPVAVQPAAPPSSVSGSAVFPPSATPAGAAASGTAPAAAAGQAVPAVAGPAGEWAPSRIRKIGQSDKIPDEVYGVVASDPDAEGGGEVIAWGRRTLHVYRVKGAELLPVVRIPRDSRSHILNVEAIDLDGDGANEIVVTSLQNDLLQSFVLRRAGGSFADAATGIPYFLVVLPDWKGKRTLVGQRRGKDFPYQGKIYAMRWDGKTLVEGDPLPADTNILPLSESGVMGLASARRGSDWVLFTIDQGEHLRAVESGGKSITRTKKMYGGTDAFEWGEISRIEGRKPLYRVKVAPRVATGTEDRIYVAATEVEKGILSGAASGFFNDSRVVLLQWDDGDFVEKAASGKNDRLYTSVDILPPGKLRRGSVIVAAEIRKEEVGFGGGESRLNLMAVE